MFICLTTLSKSCEVVPDHHSFADHSTVARHSLRHPQRKNIVRYVHLGIMYQCKCRTQAVPLQHMLLSYVQASTDDDPYLQPQANPTLAIVIWQTLQDHKAVVNEHPVQAQPHMESVLASMDPILAQPKILDMLSKTAPSDHVSRTGTMSNSDVLDELLLLTGLLWNASPAQEPSHGNNQVRLPSPHTLADGTSLTALRRAFFICKIMVIILHVQGVTAAITDALTQLLSFLDMLKEQLRWHKAKPANARLEQQASAWLVSELMLLLRCFMFAKHEGGSATCFSMLATVLAYTSETPGGPLESCCPPAVVSAALSKPGQYRLLKSVSSELWIPACTPLKGMDQFPLHTHLLFFIHAVISTATSLSPLDTSHPLQ